MSQDQQPKFEEALARLETIVSSLEDGSAPLEQSLALFEEGVSLVKLCGKQLDDAEQRIRILMKKEDGSYVEQDFTGDSI